MKGGVDMASKVFAAIDVGSNELSMKVYEITPKKGARGIIHFLFQNRSFSI